MTSALFSTPNSTPAVVQNNRDDYRKMLTESYQDYAFGKGLSKKYGAGLLNEDDSDNTTGGGSGGSGSLINSDGSLSSGFTGLVGQAKDLATFKLGQAKDWDQFKLDQDFKYGGFANQMRMKEAGQQITGQHDLENIRQNAETGRLEKSLTSQQLMQGKEFENQSTQKAMDAARAKAGLFGK
jgi:hypothetical protein